LQEGWHYLDIGCGNGAAPLLIAQNLPLQVTGLDVDPAQIQLAEAQAANMDNLRFLAHDATQLPFEAGAFDVVSSYKMTHHIPAWQVALNEMLRVLRPGGYLIYEDFAAPAVVAEIGQKVLHNAVGFPTRPKLDDFVEANKLSTIRVSRSIPFAAIWQKPA
jgi:ubiquinone/menaquinone biosynthesis C-methylase UbiE